MGFNHILILVMIISGMCYGEDNSDMKFSHRFMPMCGCLHEAFFS